MISRGIKIRVLIFVVITLLGITYVGANYVGINPFASAGCTVAADFPDSGGIFTNAEVTYRGVAVGKVGQLHLRPNGVRVDLKISSCGARRIPTSSYAQVSDRSAIGEQYVNLVPLNGVGPFIASGTVLPISRNRIPIATSVLLTNLDRLARSVNETSLSTTISELGQAFSGRGPALGSLLDSTNELLDAAVTNLPQTLALISSSATLLQTQLDEGPALASWSKSLRLLTAQLKASDPDLRYLLATGPASLATVQAFLNDNLGDLGVVLANLATTNPILTSHLGGIEQVLELYPVAVAGGLTVARGGVAHFGLVTITTPGLCEAGYGGTVKRSAGQTGPQAPNTGAQCTLPRGNATSVRGSQNAPGGDPVSIAGGTTVYPRAATADTTIGLSQVSGAALGDKSWLTVLTAGLH